MIFKFFRKDLYTGLISEGLILFLILLITVIFVSFRFSFPVNKLTKESSVAVLVTSILITSVFLLEANLRWEIENKAFQFLKMTGIQGVTFFLAKTTSTLIMMLLTYSIGSIAWFILILPDTSFTASLASFSTLIILASTALALLGVNAILVAIHGKFPHLLMFLFFLPLSIPIIINFSANIRAILDGRQLEFSMISMLLASITLSFSAGIALADYLWEE